VRVLSVGIFLVSIAMDEGSSHCLLTIRVSRVPTVKEGTSNLNISVGRRREKGRVRDHVSRHLRSIDRYFMLV
jgi:hypothetical protein